MGQMEEAKDTQAVLNGNQNDIWILLNKIGTLLPGFNRRTDLESTTVDPNHDRLFLRTRILRLPYIQIQARFTLRVKRPHLGNASLLAWDPAEVVCLIHTVIAHAIHRCLPAKLAYRLLPDKGNALVSDYIL